MVNHLHKGLWIVLFVVSLGVFFTLPGCSVSKVEDLSSTLELGQTGNSREESWAVDPAAVEVFEAFSQSYGLETPLSWCIYNTEAFWTNEGSCGQYESFPKDDTDLSIALVYETGPLSIKERIYNGPGDADPAEAFPYPFVQMTILIPRDKDTWTAVAGNKQNIWAPKPECCAPYLAEIWSVSRDYVDGNGVEIYGESSEITINNNELYLFGSEYMNRAFKIEKNPDITYIDGDRESFGSLYDFIGATTTIAQAPPIFFSDSDWTEVTAGYKDVSFLVWNQGDQVWNTDTIQFGEYRSVCLYPNNRFMLFGTPEED